MSIEEKGSRNKSRRGYEIVDFEQMESVDCPCGQTKRAFVADDNPVATLHRVDIKADSRAHYHRKLTEIYYILEGEGVMELDGEKVPVRPGMAILIRPGTRHRACGAMRILNMPVPAFDPEDEHFD